MADDTLKTRSIRIAGLSKSCLLLRMYSSKDPEGKRQNLTKYNLRKLMEFFSF